MVGRFMATLAADVTRRIAGLSEATRHRDASTGAGAFPSIFPSQEHRGLQDLEQLEQLLQSIAPKLHRIRDEKPGRNAVRTELGAFFFRPISFFFCSCRLDTFFSLLLVARASYSLL